MFAFVLMFVCMCVSAAAVDSTIADSDGRHAGHGALRGSVPTHKGPESL